MLFVQPMPPMKQVEKSFEDMKLKNKEKKRQQHLDAMLAEWRKNNGYCPHCGEPLQ